MLLGRIFPICSLQIHEVLVQMDSKSTKSAGFCNTQLRWFDTPAFKEWFESLLLPGRKVMMEDNLSTNLSKNVIALCQKSHIDFVCLPINHSHLIQPLDVSFFTPLKRGWRKILTEWNGCGGFTNSTLQKQVFP